MLISDNMKKFDLHIHTKYSDGIPSPAEVVERAVEIGLDGVAITDHDTVDGLKEGKEAADKHGIEFVPGVEITTRFGDVLVLGVEKVADSNDIFIKWAALQL